MPQFEFATYSSQLFWLTLVFGCLYFMVKNFVVPAAEQILKSREEALEENINEASNLTKKAETLKEEYNAKLQTAKGSAEDLKKETINQLNVSLSLRMAELKKELGHAAEQGNQEAKELVKSFQSERSDICINLAGFIIEKITNKKPNQQLLMECYKKVK